MTNDIPTPGFDSQLISTLPLEVFTKQDEQSPALITATVSAKVEFSISIKMDSSSLLNITQEVTRNLWQLKKYMDVYVSHLQGGISEEEFEQEATNFIR